jgi:hypothetical protein
MRQNIPSGPVKKPFACQPTPPHPYMYLFLGDAPMNNSQKHAQAAQIPSSN